MTTKPCGPVHRILRLLAGAPLVLALLTGCGGTSKEDIRRMMANRSIDRGEPSEEEEEAAEAAKRAEQEQLAANAAAYAAQAVAGPARDSGGAPTAEAAAPSAQKVQPAEADGTRVVSSDPVERATIASKNLARVSQAIRAHVDATGFFPRRMTVDNLGTPLHSWRVALLPYLGHGELYKQFRLKEPWSTPHNRKLIEKMPAVYASPERTDNKTCLLAIANRTSIMGRKRPPRRNAIEDGAENTLIVLEVAADRAVEWTRPDDFEAEINNPFAGLTTSRSGQVYVAWADGSVGSVDADANAVAVRRAVTYEAGDDFKRYQLDKPIDPSLAAAGGDAFASAAPVNRGGVSAPTTGASSETAGPGAPARGGSRLAQQYGQAASAAAVQGLGGDAWRWLAGAIGAGAPASQWAGDFRWVPGLRRPVLGVHLGVGLVGDMVREGSGTRSRPGLVPVRDQLFRESAPIGEPLLRMLEDHANAYAPASIAAPDYNPLGARRRAQNLPPVNFLEPARGVVELVRKGAIQGCDVVAAVQVEPRVDGQRSVSVTLFDVFRRERLVSSGRIVAPEGSVARARPGRYQDDPELLRDKDFQESRWRLKDYLEDKLTPTDWPVKLQPKVATKRLVSLSKSSSPWPLTALMEMRFYRAKGLVDDAQLLRAMTGLLGDDAPTLLLGTETKQRRVLRAYLPSDDPAAVVALAEQARRRAEEDDD